MGGPLQPQRSKSKRPGLQIAEKMRTLDSLTQSQVRTSSSAELGGLVHLTPSKLKTKMRKMKKKEKRRKEICRRLERRSDPVIDESLEENEKKSLLQWVEKSLDGERSEKQENSPNGYRDSSTSHNRSFGHSSNASNHHHSSGPLSILLSESNIDNLGDSLSVENCTREQVCKLSISKERSSFCKAHSFKTNFHKEENSSSTIENRVSDTALVDCVAWSFVHHNGLSLQPSRGKGGEDESLRMENGARGHCKKRKRVADQVLDYVMKRCVVLRQFPLSGSFSSRGMTRKTTIIAWEKHISITVTSESSIVREWIHAQNGNLYGLDVEWRPNRIKGRKDNKVALLQLCGENECLIIQMLFLDKKPLELSALLNDPNKRLAGVGVCMDGKRLLNDHGLLCQGTIELTTLAVEKLKRQELDHVGLKVLGQEVLGIQMQKRKSVTMSNWAQRILSDAQVEYACIDAFVSYALCQRLLAI